MHLNQLRRFLVVAETGNLRRAALQLHVSQPALTQSIHALEASLGEAVFDRGTRGVTLTECGRALMPRARLILNESERIATDVEVIRGRRVAQLMVGVGPYFTRHIFPTAVARTLELYPALQLQVIDAHTTELAAMLAEGRIELAFCVHNPRLQSKPELQFEAIYTEKYGVMARSAHPLFQRSKTTDADLNRYPWIVLDAQATAGLLFSFFERRGLPMPHWSVSTLSLSAMLGLLAKSDLLALVPQDFAQPDVAAGQLRRVTGHSLEVEGYAGFLTRRDAAPVGAALELTRQLRAVCSAIDALGVKTGKLTGVSDC
jgi:LysR family transcriptional regulator of abg operon